MLAELLAPVSPEQFVTDHWERRSLHIPGDAAKASRFFDLERFRRALADTDAAPPVGLVAGTHDRDGRPVVFPIRARQVEPLLCAGLSVEATYLERADRAIKELLAALRRDLSIAAGIHAAASLLPPGHGGRFHYEPGAMWIVQLGGSSRWWHGREPAIASPPGSVFLEEGEVLSGAAAPTPETTVEQLLRPGDVLYLPAGVWQRTEAWERSLHLRVVVSTGRLLDLVNDVLRPRLASLPAWRRLPTRLGGDGDAVTAELAERVAELRALVASDAFDAEALARAWRERVDGPSIRRTDVVTVAQPFRYQLAGEAILLPRGEVSGRLPASARRFVEALAANPSFVAERALDWYPGVAWKHLESILVGLVKLGILARG